MTNRIDYWSASWCQPCKILKPKVVALTVKHGFDFVEHDVDVETDEAIGRGILAVPTLFISTEDSLFPASLSGSMASIMNIRKAMNL